MAWKEARNGQFRVRWERDDGTIGSITGIPDAEAADAEIQELAVAQRGGTWIDPDSNRRTLAEWVAEWLGALDVDTRTEDNYRSLLKNHILPKWGDTQLRDFSNNQVLKWLKEIRDGRGRAQVTVDGIKKLLSIILEDAVAEKLIPSNPIQARRRGRRSSGAAATKEKVWGEPWEVLSIADQVAAVYSWSGALLIVTAAWTGARWGELVGLQRPNLHLFDDDTGYFTIDPKIGALHESGTALWLGPPKNTVSARDVTLPPFLVRLLRIHLKTHDHPHVFTSIDGRLHRRSNFSRRAMRPAADGNLHVHDPRVRLQPVKDGLTFHGLRHSHKTWMIAEYLPEVAQERRLGHKLPDKIVETYSHVAPEVEAKLLAALQRRWDDAVTRVDAGMDARSRLDTAWRLVAQPPEDPSLDLRRGSEAPYLAAST
jgi:integrase